jgi:hypothetical protein
MFHSFLDMRSPHHFLLIKGLANNSPLFFYSAGLVHIAAAGTSIPAALARLPYFAAVCELPEGCLGGLHPLVPSIFMKDKGYPY